MSVDASDLIDGILGEQARLNAAVDDTEINSLVADFQVPATENMGLTGAETVTATPVGVPPHKWDDGQTAYGYFTWG